LLGADEILLHTTPLDLAQADPTVPPLAHGEGLAARSEWQPRALPDALKPRAGARWAEPFSMVCGDGGTRGTDGVIAQDFAAAPRAGACWVKPSPMASVHVGVSHHMEKDHAAAPRAGEGWAESPWFEAPCFEAPGLASLQGVTLQDLAVNSLVQGRDAHGLGPSVSSVDMGPSVSSLDMGPCVDVDKSDASLVPSQPLLAGVNASSQHILGREHILVNSYTISQVPSHPISAGFKAKSMEELTARVRELERALQEAQMAREAAEDRAQKQLAEVTFLQNSTAALQAEVQALRGDRREGGSRGDGRKGGRELVEGVSAQQQSADEEEDTSMSCHMEGVRAQQQSADAGDAGDVAYVGDVEHSEALGVRQWTDVVVKIEEYDGSYECLICAESVRGLQALKCSACSSNPFHAACVRGSGMYPPPHMTCMYPPLM
jgi:hypothetical protein